VIAVISLCDGVNIRGGHWFIVRVGVAHCSWNTGDQGRGSL